MKNMECTRHRGLTKMAPNHLRSWPPSHLSSPSGLASSPGSVEDGALTATLDRLWAGEASMEALGSVLVQVNKLAASTATLLAIQCFFL